MLRVERGLLMHEQRHADALAPSPSTCKLVSLALLLGSPQIVWLMRWPSWQQAVTR